MTDVGLWNLCADAVPILLRIVFRRRFESGPVRLCVLQPWLSILALMWIVFIVVRSSVFAWQFSSTGAH